MIRELFYKLHTAFRSFIGEGNAVVLFVAASLFILLICLREKRRYRNMFTVMSPLSTIGLAVSEVIDRVAGAGYAKPVLKAAAVLFAACLSILAVTSSGKLVFSGELCEKAENEMHIPAYLVDAMNGIPEGDARVLVPYDRAPYFAAYSSRFVLSPDILKGSDESVIRTELDGIHPDMKKIAGIAHREGFEYVVLPVDIWPEIPITKCGYELVLENEGCRLYREVRDP